MSSKQNTSNSSTQDANQALWQNFVQSGLIEKAIKPLDMIEPDSVLPDFTQLNASEAMQLLKHSIVADCYKRLNAKWRKYKQRHLSNLTSLTIKAETLDRLRAFAAKAGLDGDNYDLVLEYLLDPEEDLESAKQAVAELPSGLNTQDQGQLLQTKLKLRPSSQRYFHSQLEHAFGHGWLACKAAKQRSDKHRDQACEDFMQNIKVQ
ncbi:hypothetical protein [Bowmanella yangjiangensis]|uniref:Uncharacterized protein n=1 Tax=Bowmanella yangjiangensis TaxID=2811230 RepID=A0ABS3CTS1_9ALTE|nr:hypothetical protein [Bowmanella yangjiangensis]MBN7820512.1 hypothetical protein [Bowmanella yangjiangensis]